MSIIKVTDAKSGKLKRYEADEGKPIAIISGSKLVLTDFGKKLGYITSSKGIPKMGI